MQRDHTIAYLKTRVKEILVTTDIPALGIGITKVSLVVNYGRLHLCTSSGWNSLNISFLDMPNSIEVYIDRPYHTNATGEAVTLLTKDDWPLFYDLKQVLKSSPESTCPPEWEIELSTPLKVRKDLR